MQKEYLMTFAGIHLGQSEGGISPLSLQRFLLREESVGKAMAIEELINVLNMLVTGGFLVIEHATETNIHNAVYKRFIPETLKKQDAVVNAIG